MEGYETNKISVSEHYRTSIVAVDTYSSSVFTARLYNSFYGKTVEIESFHQLLKELDKLMDEIGCPMSGMGKRTFSHIDQDMERAVKKDDEISVPKGKLATFAIRTQYRNNASWQGTVKWLEGDAEEYFRSMLDLFWLMDSALVSEG